MNVDQIMKSANGENAGELNLHDVSWITEAEPKASLNPKHIKYFSDSIAKLVIDRSIDTLTAAELLRNKPTTRQAIWSFFKGSLLFVTSGLGYLATNLLLFLTRPLMIGTVSNLLERLSNLFRNNLGINNLRFVYVHFASLTPKDLSPLSQKNLDKLKTYDQSQSKSTDIPTPYLSTLQRISIALQLTHSSLKSDSKMKLTTAAKVTLYTKNISLVLWYGTCTLLGSLVLLITAIPTAIFYAIRNSISSVFSRFATSSEYGFRNYVEHLVVKPLQSLKNAFSSLNAVFHAKTVAATKVYPADEIPKKQKQFHSPELHLVQKQLFDSHHSLESKRTKGPYINEKLSNKFTAYTTLFNEALLIISSVDHLHGIQHRLAYDLAHAHNIQALNALTKSITSKIHNTQLCRAVQNSALLLFYMSNSSDLTTEENKFGTQQQDVDLSVCVDNQLIKMFLLDPQPQQARTVLRLVGTNPATSSHNARHLLFLPKQLLHEMQNSLYSDNRIFGAEKQCENHLQYHMLSHTQQDVNFRYTTENPHIATLQNTHNLTFQQLSSLLDASLYNELQDLKEQDHGLHQNLTTLLKNNAEYNGISTGKISTSMLQFRTDDPSRLAQVLHTSKPQLSCPWKSFTLVQQRQLAHKLTALALVSYEKTESGQTHRRKLIDDFLSHTSLNSLPNEAFRMNQPAMMFNPEDQKVHLNLHPNFLTQYKILCESKFCDTQTSPPNTQVLTQGQTSDMLTDAATMQLLSFEEMIQVLQNIVLNVPSASKYQKQLFIDEMLSIHARRLIANDYNLIPIHSPLCSIIQKTSDRTGIPFCILKDALTQRNAFISHQNGKLTVCLCKTFLEDCIRSCNQHVLNSKNSRFDLFYEMSTATDAQDFHTLITKELKQQFSENIEKVLNQKKFIKGYQKLCNDNCDTNLSEESVKQDLRHGLQSGAICVHICKDNTPVVFFADHHPQVQTYKDKYSTKTPYPYEETDQDITLSTYDTELTVQHALTLFHITHPIANQTAKDIFVAPGNIPLFASLTPKPDHTAEIVVKPATRLGTCTKHYRTAIGDLEIIKRENYSDAIFQEAYPEFRAVQTKSHDTKSPHQVDLLTQKPTVLKKAVSNIQLNTEHQIPPEHTATTL